MNALRSCVLAGIAVMASGAGVQAQPGRMAAFQPPPHLGYLYPAGAQQGTTVEVIVGGQFLRGIAGVHAWGEGLQVTIGKHTRPLTAEEFFRMQDKIRELRNRLLAARIEFTPGALLSGTLDTASPTFQKILKEVGLTDDDLKAFRDFAERAKNPKRQINPQIAETVTLQIKLAPHATPGERELRLTSDHGLSNPIKFCVGSLPECRKSGTTAATETEVAESLPVVLNGQVMPGGVDRFTFKAHKGMRLVAAACARSLMPYLADAVPGWFQAALTLYDAQGNDVAYAEDFRFQPDPVLHYTVPVDGRYVLEIKDALYRGRQDFVYRVVLGELPFVTSIFPLGSRDQGSATVDVDGWNLLTNRLTLNGFDKGPGVFPLFPREQQQMPSPVLFARDLLPECLEQEPNDRLENAQPVTLPIIVNGRIDRPGDWDVFRFEGRAGNRVVAEVNARRLGSPLDSLLKLTDAAGKVLAENDDAEDKGAALLTHQADSLLWATLPADGTYYLRLGDTQHKGGPAYAYRLRISAPRPDFELRIVPSSVNARAGTSVPITVYALRHDRFTGDIALQLHGAPSGFALGGAVLPGDQDKVRLTLAVPPTPTDKPLHLSLEGRASLRGHEVSHTAVPAEDMIQAFAYHHLVPAEQWLVSISERRGANYWWKLPDERRVRLAPGRTARVRFAAPPSQLADRVKLTLSEPPEGIAIQSVNPSRDSVEIVLRADAAKAKLGLRGNLIVEAAVEFSPEAAQGKPAGEKRRLPLGVLPAIPFEIGSP